MSKYPTILSFDVGVIHLAYCLMTKKEFTKKTGEKYIDWDILEWGNIDLTNRDDMKCDCGAKASLSNVVNSEIKYYCKTHAKKVEVVTKTFEEAFIASKQADTCCHLVKENPCGKKTSFKRENSFYCTTHAKNIHKNLSKSVEMKDFKFKNSKTLNFDDVKYSLIMVLESKPSLLKADYVVIENQPSFKNPRMKSIACTIYDYYLIRGIVDKNHTKSNITEVKFMSPSNKLKVATEGDTKLLIKAKATDETKGYKMTKALGIKYCLDLIQHLPQSIELFNSHKKKDDLADAFLQGAYFYSNNIKIK